MVGRAVASRLRSAGHAVEAVSRAGTGFTVEDLPDVRELLEHADLAINCIAVLRSDASYGSDRYRRVASLVNAHWPHLLAAQAAEVRCKVLHLSTDAVFCSSTEPATEDDPVQPFEPYGLSKALGELCCEHALNVRLSVVGPAPDRSAGLWEWLLGRPSSSVVPGYSTSRWAGCTSWQVGQLASDLLASDAFARARSAGATHHFVPNGLTTKFAFLSQLAARCRPDLEVVAKEEPDPPAARPLATALDALDHVYTGPRGWPAAIQDALEAR